MSLFISEAHAASGSVAGADGTSMLIMLAVFGLVFYFMIYRPQAKRVKEHKGLMSALSKGDEVLTQGGIVGKIVKVSDEKDFIVVSVAEGTEVVLQKAAINAVLPKGTMKSL
ncbi:MULTISPECIES: preprotein translocase subunit YajC [unclassified Colwellia]|jgi:preprotein translocase subunit YajC|uniref:preprotein translocase subunit YajC n=1 Tax=unclassified Colwellia TaxID=196834 RepID=UPI0015F4CADA|nr:MULTISPECIES: preprotein translocase subunit YajC [unclassified Colwellia]MBA6230850.1 preprotein translocase subunit YajC [Colwellia sp. MB02u-7]MBA6234781.1 preprotein translocase subunit YajC [Colwellia sp. MB02u-11]MBA6255644.1 preprotein translocase subunit YajC [Colwellia sp. MB3u-28]MBA6261785.1 preprotein translocase subunit YajC [Colwellia sp. MB3u-41]MBA6263141.1 preprotein translocase subunit YajC [Colwellia sp. Bg11-12]